MYILCTYNYEFGLTLIVIYEYIGYWWCRIIIL